MNIIVIKLTLPQNQCHIKIGEKMEKITVIIPVYNVKKYIRRCIESTISQTYENLEILIIIDGSTDGSEEIVKEYAQKDTRIKIIDRENKGIFYTRIEGIKKATSDYLYFLDADDWIEKNTIETMYQYKEKYQANVVRCQNYYKDEEEKVGQRQEVECIEKKDFKEKLYLPLFGTYDYASIWNQLIEKKRFEELEESDYAINFGEDYLLNLKLYKNIETIVLVPDYLYHYRTNDMSITNQQNYEGLLKKLESAYKSHLAIINQISPSVPGVVGEDLETYQKIGIFRAIRAIKNRMIEFASFGLKHGKGKEVQDKVEEILNRQELKQVCKQITTEELLKLAKEENHKYVMKNIKQGKAKKVMNYIKIVYIPGKKIKKMMRR